MTVINIVTINILSDLSRWTERRNLLVQGLAAIEPDLIAIQEVRLPQNPARWLAEELGFKHLYLTPKAGIESSREAIAIVSRYPFERQESLDLGGQGRVAQYVLVKVDERHVLLVNGHFYWQPGESRARLKQIENLLKWLEDIPGDPPSVVCGDFNSTPETASIQRMRQHFASAYASVHGNEPEYTCPTPLPRARRSQLRTLLGFFLLIRPKHLNPTWRGTLDYIFVDPRLKVQDCQIVLDQPAPDNPKIYPSDHFGLHAKIEIGAR